MNDIQDIEQLYIPEFEKYLKAPEPSIRERADYWRTAIGLQAVDQLTVSDFLKQTAQKHIEGKITTEDAEKQLKAYYRAKGNAQSAIQSANTIGELPSKCKNCTLEEVAVLRIVQQNPAATQKQIATQISKSERTVKTITVNLTQKGILLRRNGKRNGYWEILND